MADGKEMIFAIAWLTRVSLEVIAWAFLHYGMRTASVNDRLKELGFRYATKAGISISVDDLMIPPKSALLEAAEAEIAILKPGTRNHGVERFQVIDTWNSTEALKDEVVDHFKASDPLNSVYMMAFSGARCFLSAPIGGNAV